MPFKKRDFTNQNFIPSLLTDLDQDFPIDSRKSVIEEVQKEFSKIDSIKSKSESFHDLVPIISVQSSSGGGKTTLLNILAKSFKNDIISILITFNEENTFKNEDPISTFYSKLLCR